MSREWRGDRVSWHWIWLAIVAISAATLAPQPEWNAATANFAYPTVPATAGEWMDAIQNIVLYVPLGFALFAVTRSAFYTFVIAAALSTTTELLQFYVPGRDPSANDILANIVGALVGGSLVVSPAGRLLERALVAVEGIVRWGARARGSTRGHLAFAWATVVAAIVAASAFLAAPAPPNPQYLVVSPRLDSHPGPVRIGNSGPADGVFQGLIDEVRLYSRPRTQEMIRGDMVRPVSADRERDPDLVAAFGFDEGSGTTAHDGSGDGHDASVRGAAWETRGRFGGALSFDGRSSEVVVPAAAELDFRDALTLEAWVRPEGQPGPEPAVIEHAGATYFLQASSRERPFQIVGGGTFGAHFEGARPLRPLARDRWTHLALTYGDQELRVYVDGELAAERTRWSPHKVERFSLNGLDLVPGLLKGGEPIPRALLGSVAIRSSIACGPLASRFTPLFRLVGPGGVDVLSIRASRADLLIGSATRPRRLGFASPYVRVAGALNACEPGGRLQVDLDGPITNPQARIDGHAVRSFGPGVGSGWAFIFHSELLRSWLESACTLAWLALVLLPFGFWARRDRWTLVGVLLIVCACAYFPSLWRIHPVRPIEAAATLVGAAAGALLSRRAASDSIPNTCRSDAALPR